MKKFKQRIDEEVLRRKGRRGGLENVFSSNEQTNPSLPTIPNTRPRNYDNLPLGAGKEDPRVRRGDIAPEVSQLHSTPTVFASPSVVSTYPARDRAEVIDRDPRPSSNSLISSLAMEDDGSAARHQRDIDVSWNTTLEVGRHSTAFQAGSAAETPTSRYGPGPGALVLGAGEMTAFNSSAVISSASSVKIHGGSLSQDNRRTMIQNGDVYNIVSHGPGTDKDVYTRATASPQCVALFALFLLCGILSATSLPHMRLDWLGHNSRGAPAPLVQHSNNTTHEPQTRCPLTLLDGLPNHPSYTSLRSDYLNGSRSDVITDIRHWIDNSSQPVLWLYGAAGLGKSTIGHQLVFHLQSENRLAAAVFIPAIPAQDQHPTMLIRMMAKDLAGMHSSAICSIVNAMETCNSAHHSLGTYLTKYIINPIKMLSLPDRLVVIFDAMDEWAHRQVFLDELGYVLSTAPVKFLLISRFDHGIERALAKTGFEPYELPPVSQAVVERYFNHHFEEICWNGRRPDQRSVAQLAAEADGLLIWAATVCTLISPRLRITDPHSVVEQILSSSQQVSKGRRLQDLYRAAIVRLFPEPAQQEMFQVVVATMMVLQEPLPVREFAVLVSISESVVRDIRLYLEALRTRGVFDGEIVTPAAQQFHASFLEFLLHDTGSSHAARPYNFWATAKDAHSTVAKACLDIVFRQVFLPHRKTLSDFRRLERYAIKFWPLHLVNGTERTPVRPSDQELIDHLAGVADDALRRWAVVFGSLVSPSLNMERELTGSESEGAMLFHDVAAILKDGGMAQSHQVTSLEVGVRLQPDNPRIWEALREAYLETFRRSLVREGCQCQ